MLGAALAPTATRADSETSAPVVNEVARQDQNPLTRYYILRIEDNAQMGFGPDDEVLNFVRVQPLFPVSLEGDWRLLVRPVLPIVHQPGSDAVDGLGDLALSFLLTPARTGKFSWGLGSGLLLPTATDDRLGTEKWAAGPTLAGAYVNGPWTVGVVVQNMWSFAGEEARHSINTMTLRPILNFNLSDGWYLTSSPSVVANWEAKKSERWLVPLGGGLGKAFLFGGRRVSTTLEAYYHVESPTVGPDWQVRLQFSVLYPD